MALFANYLTFAKRTDVGVQTITGVGFQGKALLLWSTRLTAHGTSSAGAQQVVAMTDGITSSCRHIHHPGGQTATTSAQSERVDALIFMTNATSGATPTTEVVGVFGSWTADGFTINWTTNDGVATRFHVLVIGGPDIQITVKQVKITVAHNETLPVTGVGFRPDSFIVMGGAADEFGGGGGGYSLGAPFGSIHGFGFSNATENICSWTLGRGTGFGSDNYSGLHSNRAASVRTANLPGAGELCGVSVIATTSDGFTLLRHDANPGHEPVQHILCIKGALFKLGTFTAPASLGTLTVPLTFRAGLFIAQTHSSTVVSVSDIDGLNLMIGAWVTRIGQGGTWIGGTDNASPSVYKRSSYTGYLIQTRHPTTLAVTCQAAVTTSTTSGLTLNFNVTSAMTFIYLALGSIVPGGQTPMFTTGGTTGPLSWIELMLKTDAE